MISERQLARGFSGFWQDLLPLLTPRFVKLLNEGYVEALNNSNGDELHPIPVGIDNEHPAIVAETAFFLAKLAHENSTSVTQASENPALRNVAAKCAINMVDSFKSAPVDPDFELSTAELNEAVTIAKYYDYLYPHLNEDLCIKFSPIIQGAGFMPVCHADLSISETLFEIKTVNRNLSGKDLRQLMIYLALQASTGNRRWTSAGFFNPRRGTIAQFMVDPFVFRLSGGRPPSDVFDELVAFVSNRDALFDTAF